MLEMAHIMFERSNKGDATSNGVEVVGAPRARVVAIPASLVGRRMT